MAFNVQIAILVVFKSHKGLVFSPQAAMHVAFHLSGNFKVAIGKLTAVSVLQESVC